MDEQSSVENNLNVEESFSLSKFHRNHNKKTTTETNLLPSVMLNSSKLIRIKYECCGCTAASRVEDGAIHHVSQGLKHGVP